MDIYLLALVIFLLLLSSGAFWLLRRRRFPLNLQVLLVKLPRRETKDPKDFLQDINLAEQFISSLASIKEPVILETAVHNSGAEIYFYVAAPRENAQFVARQIQGFFPDAQVDEAPDYTIFAGEHGVRAGYLALSTSPVIPIRTYREAEVDSFAPIVSTLSRLREEGDGAAFQLVLRPAGGAFKKRALNIISRLKKGESFKKILKSHSPFYIVDEVARELSFAKTKPDEPKAPAPADSELVETLEGKIRKPLFEVNIRVIAAGDNEQDAADIMVSMAGAFSQFAAPRKNSFRLITPKKVTRLVYQYVFREFDPKQALVLNTEEIASLFHFPTVSTDIPRIKWLKSREAPPPQNLPAEGVVVGLNTFRGDKKFVRMSDNDRRRHFYVVGQTGTGKSFFMLNTIAQDMKAGKGLCVIDPHGELVEKVLERVPASRLEDVIIFNPGDVARPLGLNMLEFNADRPEEKTFIVNEIQSIFNRLFDKETMGPMF